MVSETRQFVLCQKMQNLKGVLKQLNTKHFAYISTWVDKVNMELKEAQTDLLGQPTNVLVQSNDARLRKEAMALCEAEIIFYYQQAKCSYLKGSDRCTKFFHVMLKKNAKRNFVVVVSKEDGTITTSYDQMAEAFID